jgi:RNA recognition motif-containing protein
MNKKLYMGNLNYSVTNEELREKCSEYGEVTDVKIIEGRGFGFVEFAEPEQAEAAQEALDGTEFKGRTMKVNEARPPKDKRRQRNFNNNRHR